MINIDKWLACITEKLKLKFSDRLLFVGLQGSYQRKEATPESDIDLVVLLKELNFEDLKTYKDIIKEMPNNEKACGFISGRNEISKWSKTDLFQFYYDTEPILGNLSAIIKPPTKEEIKISVKTACENLYHTAVHSFLHSNNLKSDIEDIYKMAFFILQAKYFIEKNDYISTKNKLKEKLEGEDLEILNISINRKGIFDKKDKEIEYYYEKIIKWSSNNI